MIKLGEELALYIYENDNEEEDYINFCEENELKPYNFAHKHIFAVASNYLYKLGYELNGEWK